LNCKSLAVSCRRSTQSVTKVLAALHSASYNTASQTKARESFAKMPY